VRGRRARPCSRYADAHRDIRPDRCGACYTRRDKDHRANTGANSNRYGRTDSHGHTAAFPDARADSNADVDAG
jgi:hypothetical protein